MNDYWNDPPEEPDEQTCKKCDGYGEVAEETDNKILFRCFECDHEWSLPFPVEPDPPEEVVVEEVEEADVGEEKCPHGSKWGDCDACDYASDIAYDAARESRVFGR